MKYKKGSIVEVLVKDEHCYNCWRCAQILSGNGHNYTVSYNVYPCFTNEEDVDRVSRKSIRPCPPMLEVAESWVPGDAVEVFHNLSWRMAIVLKNCGWDQFLVRVVGSFQEFEVTKSELRVRQSYQNGEWVVIGKVPRNYKDTNCAKIRKYDRNIGCLTKENAAILDFYLKDVCIDTQNNHHRMKSCIVSSKTLKRASPYCYFQGEANEERPLKFRVSGKEGRRLQVLGTSQVKVDDVANNRDMKKNINGTNGSERAQTLVLNDTDSIVSSTGSCSANSYKPYDMYCGSGNDSDAESTCRLGYLDDTDQSHRNKMSADECHRLELQAYRSTMEALHAEGPLTWEKETMLTDLRLSLHISNDEHLLMIKRLISASSSVQNR